MHALDLRTDIYIETVLSFFTHTVSTELVETEGKQEDDTAAADNDPMQRSLILCTRRQHYACLASYVLSGALASVVASAYVSMLVSNRI